ncbi:TraB/GumN family protein [Clostridium sp. 'White wine YQ']|uniref:TraB/GumN family protein n=1 Tax=Clostridium sp. 'White wine YQ' TaxID=3027474 RepID=UPI002364FC64|nr:TraB/GumN family protein [Clostridium sp. 'White wine YQ']MDD7795872.1 TraB/GumN family protein [Clostridium sp. 'White wine YQ']
MKRVIRLISVFTCIVLFAGIAFGCGKQTDQLKEVKGIFYKVEKDGKYLYIGGSIHLGNDKIKFSDKVESAYKESNKLGVEIDITDPGISDILSKESRYNDGDNLDKHLKPETKEYATKLLEEVGAKYNGEISKLKPWALETTISALQYSASGFKADNGLDMIFITRAKSDNKAIVSLEDFDTQYKAISFGDDEFQNESLMKLTKLSETKKQLHDLYTAVVNGDTEYVEKMNDEVKSGDKMFRDYYNAAVTQRNLNMETKIEEFLKTNDKYFIVVGAEHVVGEDGLVTLLKNKGYTVTRLE